VKLTTQSLQNEETAPALYSGGFALGSCFGLDIGIDGASLGSVVLSIFLVTGEEERGPCHQGSVPPVCVAEDSRRLRGQVLLVSLLYERWNEMFCVIIQVR